MKVLITGATGLIGGRLQARFDAPILTSRNPERAEANQPGAEFIRWPISRSTPPPATPIDTVFHLAGEPVAGSRWTEDRMHRIRESRVAGTRDLVDWLSTLDSPPKTLVCASAIGFYGDRGDEALTEGSEPGDSFLAEVCDAWEAEARRAEALGTRVVCVRIGIVLSAEGGALKEMMTPFKLGVGGPLGDGQQWMSWIHIDDVVGLLEHLASSDVSGAVNAVAPEPARNEAFSKAFASALGRPSFFRAPAFALRLALGKMSDIVLASQRVFPARALDSGYTFRFPELGAALKNCLETT